MRNNGQTIIEYVLLIGIVTMAVVYMGTDFRRGIQSVVKVTADQMGRQVNSDQDFSSQTQAGVLLNSQTNTWQGQQKSKWDRIGVVTKQQGDFTQTFTNSITNETLSQRTTQ